MIPLNRIEVLNPRERNSRVFEQIVGNIQNIGLKKPIIVTPRPGSCQSESNIFQLSASKSFQLLRLI